MLANGVDIVQLREKNLEAADELDLLAVFADACRRHGALLAVNDRADIAVAAGADVLHVGQRDLPPATARGLRRPRRRRSAGPATASSRRWPAAQHPDVDYFCVGPVWATPTKPGRPGIGLEPIRAVAELSAEQALVRHRWHRRGDAGGRDRGRGDAGPWSCGC